MTLNQYHYLGLYRVHTILLSASSTQALRLYLMIGSLIGSIFLMRMIMMPGMAPWWPG